MDTTQPPPETAPRAKKKLLIATDNFLPRWDGIARFLDELLPTLEKHFSITVLAPVFPGYEGKTKEHPSVTIKRIKSSNLRIFGEYVPAQWDYQRIAKEVKQHDIVWVQASGPIGAPAILAAKRHRKPCLAYMHSIEWELTPQSMHKRNLLRPLMHILARLWNIIFYNMCTTIMVPTQEVGELLSWNGIITEKVIVPLGIQVNRFKPATDKRTAKEQLGINPSEQVIGYCGRIGREKNLVTLYRAFAKVCTHHPHVKLLVVGKGVADHKTVEVPQEHVMEVGEQNNVVPYLQAMDIYVLPSLTETTSLSTMEAMSCGCAVIATKVGLVAEYIKEKVNGMFFPKRNDTVLALKLRKLLKDETLRDVLSQNARRTIVEQYNWEKTPKKIVEVLKEFSG